LANGGPGSLDVIEIDAASHGGVEDARDLRERAFYAPVSSRYKVYIIDEAHMVTREGFNALLKLVEEPPEHVKFVFATTEPDKVLATIRSRTHHYAFRLVAPRILSDHLARVAAEEGVTIEESVLPMVVRAGAGSVRDALSVLDQLIAGSTENSISMSYASGLLGYTDGKLLDDVIDAFATRRGDAVFETLDRALDSGLDPRRFVADLLERFRDLLILTVAGADTDHLDALITAAPDELDRMKVQASSFGLAELTRNAEVLSHGLVEMRGATSPRLLLEIMAARLLLPGAEDTERGLHVRIEQLERQGRVSAVAAAAAPAPTVAEPARAPRKSQTSSASVSDTPVADEPAAKKASTKSSSKTSGGTEPDALRRKWPEIVDGVKNIKRSAWIQLNRPGSGILSVEQGRVAVGLPDAGTAKGFIAGGYDDLLAGVISEVMGSPYTVDIIGQAAPDAPVHDKPAPEPKKAPGPVRSSGRDIIEADQVLALTEPAVDDDEGESDATDLTGEDLIKAVFDAKAIGEIDSI
jgi:DNA polymerase-3 subunit gamma/tau